MRRTGRLRVAASALIAVGVAGLAWAGLAAGMFAGTQLRLADGLFPAVGPDPRIVVVAIDDRSLAEVGTRWPWPRDIHADLVEGLEDAGAAWIGYDVSFLEPAGEEEDARLAEALERSGSVLLAAHAELAVEGGEVPTAVRTELPIPELDRAAAAVGFVNVVPDPDGVVRALPPVIDAPRLGFSPSLSLALYLLEEGAGGPVTVRPEGVQVGDRLVPTGPGHLMDVNFARGFATYGATDVLRGRVPADAFRDRIVLVGATAIGLGDHKLTPLDRSTGEPGVLVHASALNTMLQGAFLSHDPIPLVVAAILALAFLVALAVAFLRTWAAPPAAAAAGGAYYLLAFWRFDRGEVMNLFYPALALLLAYMAGLAVRYFTEVRERRRVTSVFGRYVAGDVVEEVLAAPEHALATLKGASRPISVLFADLRGFTSASEGATPEEVVAGLNEYLDAMVRAVNQERGTIDKFMGDCVMAFWGAPRDVPNHPELAVRAAMRMLDLVDEAKERADAIGLRVPGCGVGVATGEAVVGNIGSQERLDYTVIGDTVNTASRICGVAEAGEIVVTEECAARLGDAVDLAPLPPLSVKGKRERLRIFQVLRPGQRPKAPTGEVTEVASEKAHFEMADAPPKAAGYAPVEPRPGGGDR